MFALIEAESEIAAAQRKLEATIQRNFKTTAVKNIGYPGGQVRDSTVRTNGIHWFWSSDCKHKKTKNPRRLNWFGIFTEGSNLHISVEINTAYEGRNDRVAGFFARYNRTGSIYLCHSGRIGGGTAGVGKTAFLAWGDHRTIEVFDSSGHGRKGVLVMPIEGKGATQAAARYIDSIARFKQAARDGELETKEFLNKRKCYEDFYSEPRGRRRDDRSSEIDYLSRHGEVIDALQAWRKSQPLPRNGRFVKNALIDMGVEVDGKLAEVFEAKTSAERSDVYQAIGQLMVHGTSNNCRRVFVLPSENSLGSDLKLALRRLNIEVLKFRFDRDSVDILPERRGRNARAGNRV